jgi:3-hydroxymyristoyl/3-hydroxydecanoyl-(acyl carrier protein) dehydratase
MSAPDDLTPHRNPFRLVDRLRSSEDGVAIAERRVTADDPLVGDALPATLIVEALAQTAALIAGAEVGQHRGFLVALKDVRVESAARPGDTLELSAQRTGTLGALHRVRAEARVGGRLILGGELTFAIES